MVEDLTVVGHDVPSAWRAHRLVPFGREVQDRQAAMAKPYCMRFICPFAQSVRPTLRETVTHQESDLGAR